jgi:nucleotide-binding universal stress UspA family protein
VKRFRNILFVAEAEANDPAAFDQAVTLANDNQAQLTVIGIVEDAGTLRSTQLRDAMVEERLEALRALVKANAAASDEVETKVLIGRPFMEVIRDVIRFRRDLVIKSIGAAHSVGQRLFGGTDKKLLRKCPCPVWLIKSTKQQGYRQVLVALDYEPENPESDPLNRQLLEMAGSIALSEFCDLHVVHAWRLEHESFLRSARTGLTREDVDELVGEEEQTREHWIARLVHESFQPSGRGTEEYLKPKVHLLQGRAESVVLQCAEEIGAELVVMGTVARTGIPGFTIGNTAESILGELDCSVLAIKPVGFAAPVTLDE